MIFLLLVTSFLSCHSINSHSNKDEDISLKYNSFEEYRLKTIEIIKENRDFLTSNHNKEIYINSPFEIKPKSKQNNPKKGIILVHGLGDSPYSFCDISRSLANKGFLVRTILLSGHGTKPSDLISSSHLNWKETLSKHVELLKTKVDKVYLGGFSTGGNLVVSYAYNDEDIEGLILFSPGFKSDSSLISLTPFLSKFKKWIYKNENKNTNYTRYNSIPVNGFAQYYYTSKNALFFLNKRPYNKPVFLALSNDDSILDSNKIKNIFNKSFTNSKSRLFYFTSTPKKSTEKIIYLNSFIPRLRISNMSHMGILFSPENRYYGLLGSEKIYRNGQNNFEPNEIPTKNSEIWYSAWGYNEPNKFHARLTFNPYYNEMIEEILKTIN